MSSIEALLQLPKYDIEAKLFELGDFDFITVKDGQKHLKQEEALRLLTDDETKEVGYGGAAGGAKSWTGCSWLAFMCKNFPGIRGYIGREELKRLRESTLITFYKVCAHYEITGWKYNGQDHYIAFENGSRIDLLDLKWLPSDPLYERYGSIEYTIGWIEEAGETHFDAFDTLKSRVGRHLNDKYGIVPKVLVTFNPKKNWVYTYFYRPYKDRKMPEGRRFIVALLYDNPHRESNYEAQLKGMTKAKRERLLYGNFEYDDDPTVLCEYDAIVDLFTNDHVKGGKKYISADLAMQGRDKFIAGPWDGLIGRVTIDKDKAGGKEIEEDLKKLMIDELVPRSQTVADSDGLGAYLVSYLTGIKEFHGNAKPSNKEFFNLKSECGYKLAELINKRMMKIICTDTQRQAIIEELGVLKSDEVDNDEKKKRIIDKKQMKELLGRSPDYLDWMLMRMFFEVKTVGKVTEV